MNDKDFNTVQAMKKHGGSFVKALAGAAEVADPNNLELIKQTWHDYWKKYEAMGNDQPPINDKDERKS